MTKDKKTITCFASDPTRVSTADNRILSGKSDYTCSRDTKTIKLGIFFSTKAELNLDA